MFQELVDIQDELEAVEIERQTLEEQVTINNDELANLRHEMRNVTTTNESLEEKVKDLQGKMADKDVMLQNYEEQLSQLQPMRRSTIGGSFLRKGDQGSSPAMVPIEEFNELQFTIDDKIHEINTLNEELRQLGKRYDDEQVKAENYHADFKKFEEEYAKSKKSNSKLRTKVETLQDERDELRDKCDVLQEEYDKLVSI